jgi:hypothetical protein
LTIWVTIASLGDLAPVPVGRDVDRLVRRGDQERRQVLAARAARVAGLALLKALAHAGSILLFSSLKPM